MARRKVKLKKDGTPRAKPKWNPNSAFRGALRRVFARSPKVIAVKLRARKEESKYNKDGSLSKKPAVLFQCAECKKWYKGTHVAVDHIEPVINPETSFVDWDTFIERLDCPEDNLQVLCSYTNKHEDAKKEYGRYSCHYFKTQAERKKAKEFKDAKNET